MPSVHISHGRATVSVENADGTRTVHEIAPVAWDLRAWDFNEVEEMPQFGGHDYATQLRGRTDDELLAMDRIGPVTLRRIRQWERRERRRAERAPIVVQPREGVPDLTAMPRGHYYFTTATATSPLWYYWRTADGHLREGGTRPAGMAWWRTSPTRWQPTEPSEPTTPARERPAEAEDAAFDPLGDGGRRPTGEDAGGRYVEWPEHVGRTAGATVPVRRFPVDETGRVAIPVEIWEMNLPRLTRPNGHAIYAQTELRPGELVFRAGAPFGIYIGRDGGGRNNPARHLYFQMAGLSGDRGGGDALAWQREVNTGIPDSVRATGVADGVAASRNWAAEDIAGRFRYRLTVQWDEAPDSRINPVLRAAPAVCFVLACPGEAPDGPEIAKGVELARRMGCKRAEFVGLFARRVSDPAELGTLSPPEAVGADNTDAILDAMDSCEIIVAAWGGIACEPWAAERAGEVVTMLNRCGRLIYHFGLTEKGCPAAPVDLPDAAEPLPFRTAMVPVEV